eukprot:TRINITY_DN12423_c0_g1_i1.p1 TRINITY_DN12423_c0_g1~~TRINITY_DN12423_c0_g1_i1.p1  ORF type:complete len:404 (+),score=54.70 TRINITY_DN12423_c0_g1_i1:194-1405(+)
MSAMLRTARTSRRAASSGRTSIASCRLRFRVTQADHVADRNEDHSTCKPQALSLCLMLIVLGVTSYQCRLRPLGFSVPPAGLHPYVPWRTGEELASANWVDDNVLSVHLDNSTLSTCMAGLCLDLEANADPEPYTSSQGGYHSKDLSSCRDQFLLDFKAQIDRPLSSFLHRQLRGKTPAEVESCEDLCISAVVQTLWVNVNRHGASNARHNHEEDLENGLGGLQAAGVYYPSLDASSQTTSRACIRFYPEGRAPVSVRPTPGTMLLFAPDLLHDTETVSAAEGPRLSVAFNVHARWLTDPVLRAAARGIVSELRQLVAQGAGLEEAELLLGFRALHLAAEAGHVEAVKELVRAGADTSALSKGGWSPLGLAWERKHELVWSLLGGDRQSVIEKLRSGPGSPNR